MPIFPCIRKYYNIEYNNNDCGSWYHSDIIDSKSYITKYITELYFND
jgi:hypothetical protein